MPEVRRSLSVLVAEDNDLSQRLAVGLLEKRGHEVEVAGNGREVLEKIAFTDYDAVLMDIEMPELNGLETTSAIRAVEKFPEEGGHLPILAMTAHNSEEDIEICFAHGMDGYVEKPIRSEHLYAALEDAVLLSRIPGSRRGSDTVRERVVGRVLVVEDNPINQRLLQHLLSKAGYEVVLAENGQRAVEVVRSIEFDLCFMDLQMPVMNGIEATERIRGQGLPYRLPIVALTSAYRELEWQACYRAGMDHFLKKPVEPDAIRETLTRFVTTPIQQRQSASLVEQLQSGPYLDEERVWDEVAQDAEFLAELAELFDSNTADLMGLVQELIEREEAVGLRQAAHSLKSPIGSFTHGQPMLLVDRLENLARESDFAGAGRLVPELQSALDRLRQEIHQFSEKCLSMPSELIIVDRAHLDSHVETRDE